MLRRSGCGSRSRRVESFAGRTRAQAGCVILRRRGARSWCSGSSPRTRTIRPWKTVEDLELDTLDWVHWHNTQRLHGELCDLPPVEFENAVVAVPNDRNLLVEIK
ncbi:IS3 family transposase [Microbacterium halotolerans]|uniref:IS3 family transposase n=1 Tax=Microbacterium halotolerans TaxID=246613 RepID=UPI003B846F66